MKPIPKMSDPIDVKDLRPISVLPFMSKIVKVIYSRLTKYLNTINIFPQKQSSFRVGRSTITEHLDVVDNAVATKDDWRWNYADFY